MNDADAIDLLERMVRTPSVSTREGELAAWMASELRALGFRTMLDEVGNLRASIGPKDAPIDGVLLGHLDTVPGELPVRRTAEALYGRGSVDAKGPLACFVAAALRATQALGGDDSPLRLELIGCVEEEVPSSRGARHVLSRRAPDFCIVGEPSGWNGITLGYKGCLNARLHFEVAGHHGAHADASACERACAAWQSIASAASAFGGDTLYEQLLTRLSDMSSSATADGIDHATLTVALRLPESLPPEAARAWLSEHAHADRIDFDGAIPAWSSPRHSPLVRTLQRAILQHNTRPRVLRKTGTADLNLVAPAWGCPAVAYGPGDAALDHTPQEHIRLDEFCLGISVLSQSLCQWTRATTHAVH